MKNKTIQKNYDVAFSLCKEDNKLAAAINKKLNPSICSFFYGHNQQELINKNGSEEFAKIFRERSKLVVILYRDDWSKSYYTELEMNAIIDRTKKGYDFLLVIQMEPGATPAWYPETRIYTKAYEHTVDELVKFIEFKLTELGINYKPLTFEDKIKNIEAEVEAKKKKNQYLSSLEINKHAMTFLNSFIDKFNSYFELLKGQNLVNWGWQPISNRELHSLIEGKIGLNRYEIRFTVINIGGWRPSSQNFYLQARLIKNNSELIKEPDVYRLNVDIDNYDLMGWSKEIIIEDRKQKLFEVYLPYHSKGSYLLDDELISNEGLIEKYLIQLLEMIEEDEKRKH